MSTANNVKQIESFPWFIDKQPAVMINLRQLWKYTELNKINGIYLNILSNLCTYKQYMDYYCIEGLMDMQHYTSKLHFVHFNGIDCPWRLQQITCYWIFVTYMLALYLLQGIQFDIFCCWNYRWFLLVFGSLVPGTANVF